VRSSSDHPQHAKDSTVPISTLQTEFLPSSGSNPSVDVSLVNSVDDKDIHYSTQSSMDQCQSKVPMLSWGRSQKKKQRKVDAKNSYHRLDQE